jgi:dihydrofolate synthase/folylpolyglutamate synthase
MQQLADYAASIAYLEDLITHPILSREQAGLARIRVLLQAVGDPQHDLAGIQIAGTNGKGSTTTMLAAIVHAAGYRTGAFTSPHMQSYRERIAIDGLPVDEASWVAALNRLLPVLARMEANDLPGYSFGRAAFLEVLWAMACLIYAEQLVRFVAIETGLGGRLDPTSVNEAAVSTITNVSLDHTERLGSTVEAIATEKAGVIKPGQNVVSAADPAPLAVIAATCVARGATLWRAGPAGAVQVQAESPSLDAPLTISTPLRRHTGLRLGLRGLHQRLNAACAVGAIDAFVRQTGMAIPPEAVAHGLSMARIPGRLELIEGSPDVLLDGAHNVAGAESLVAALQGLFAHRRLVLLLGILGDKDVLTITDLLTPLAAAVVVAEPPWKSRAGSSGLVAARARLHVTQVEEITEPAAALARARALACPGDLIVVAGSLYLVGAIREILVPLDARRSTW